jgi:hypothetical protein
MSAHDQVIDAGDGVRPSGGRHSDASADGWIIMHDNATRSGAFVARLVTDAATPSVLLADMLAGLRDQLPPGLTRTDRPPAGHAGWGIVGAANTPDPTWARSLRRDLVAA